MRYIIFFIFSALTLFAISMFAYSPIAQAENYSPHPNGMYGHNETLPDLLNIKGSSYHKARGIILTTGWKPLKTFTETTDILSGNGPIFWGMGYHELSSCSGTGLAHCAFLFQNHNGDTLRVITEGEECDEDSGYTCFATVAAYTFQPSN